MRLRKHITIPFVLIGLTIFLYSCLKQTTHPPLYGWDTPNVVSFQDNGGSSGGGAGFGSTTTPYPSYNFSFKLQNDTAGFDAIVIYGPSGPAAQDITLTLAVDTAALNAFNTANSTGYVCPDASTYSFPASVVLPKGQSQAYVHVTIKASSSFDFTASYALPLTITSASYGTISPNMGSEINIFAVQNQYDGIYDLNGIILREGDPVLSGTTSGQISMTTSGPNSIQYDFHPWHGGSAVGGIDGLTLTVDPATNKVTVSSVSNPVLVNLPGYDSRYDPSSKTFYVSYYWGTGPTNRAATDTLVYSGPR